MDKLSYLSNTDPGLLEELYRQYKANPDAVEAGWKRFFEGFDFARTDFASAQPEGDCYSTEFNVINLINGYRQRGHLFTLTNPVRARRKYSPSLDIENFGLTAADLEKEFEAGNEIGIGKAKLREIVSHLQETYCRSIGIEFLYIRHPEVLKWFASRMEGSRNTYPYTDAERRLILKNLGRAVLFEKFVHKRFPGQKRFSLEGAEALIPGLEVLIETGAGFGVQEFVIGMPHRGRINVLANILKKSYSRIFSEFEGKDYEDEELLGDVKYHLGFVNRRTTTTGKQVSVTLAPNPSHLEAVDPVVQGIARAKIDERYGGDESKLVPVLIHGDASVAAQGVVYEVLQMSGLKGYKTGGTIHLVVNNQVGFTTNYIDGRTSTYCTDVAKTVLSPVFHVNGDDVEAVLYAVSLAMEYRNRFHNDVFIDLLCYRKYGHSEGDEPRFTQPVLYKIIEKHPDPLEIYKRKLTETSGISSEEIIKVEAALNEVFEENMAAARKTEKVDITFAQENWEQIMKALPDDFDASPSTGVPEEVIRTLGTQISEVPQGMGLFRKILRLQENRREMVQEGVFDWAMSELLAYATLLKEGFPVRISGQDSVRGTFSHRHAALRIEDSEEEYVPLRHLSPDQAQFEIYNSLLSEYGVLGFEYGYALACPNGLTVWEAQFGDFSNGAQIIFDQFISSAEDKWSVMNGLVALLPHGYEGQGPEHSSARIERFLTLSAEFNMQVVNCTTPANFFHVLRRQLHRPFRKPLIVFTPKSLLRHPACISPINDFASGGFREVIDEEVADTAAIQKVVFCSGKLFYELKEEKEKLGNTSVALVRIEQLFPVPFRQIEKIRGRYAQASSWLWVQEEPLNMGAWPFVHLHWRDIPLRVISRPASGSPATGLGNFHTLQQRKIIEKTFGECQCPLVKEQCNMVCIGNKWRSFLSELEAMNTEGLDTGSVNAERRLR